MLDECLLVIGEGFLVEVSPAAFVEVECLRLGDGGAGVGLPCQRAQAGIVPDGDRRRFCCWRVEDRDDEVKSECGGHVDVGADRDRGLPASILYRVTRETPAASAQATTVTPRAFRRSRSRAPRRSRSACCSGLVYGLGAGMFLILVIQSLMSIMGNISKDLSVKRLARAKPAVRPVRQETLSGLELASPRRSGHRCCRCGPGAPGRSWSGACACTRGTSGFGRASRSPTGLSTSCT